MTTYDIVVTLWEKNSPVGKEGQNYRVEFGGGYSLWQRKSGHPGGGHTYWLCHISKPYRAIAIYSEGYTIRYSPKKTGRRLRNKAREAAA